MEALNASITKRVRSRTLRSGQEVKNVRYVLNYRAPDTGKRTQRFFKRHKDALCARDELVLVVRDGNYKTPKHMPTVAEAVAHWLPTF